jgi:hypothetical protein
VRYAGYTQDARAAPPTDRLSPPGDPTRFQREQTPNTLSCVYAGGSRRLTLPTRPSPPSPQKAPSETSSKKLSSEDVIKYTKDFIAQFREVRVEREGASNRPYAERDQTQNTHQGFAVGICALASPGFEKKR